MAPVARTDALKSHWYGPGSAAAVPASFQYVMTLTVVPLSVRGRTRVHPEGAVLMSVPEPPRTVIAAIITSFSAVLAGRATLMLAALFTEFVDCGDRKAIAPNAGGAAATDKRSPTSALANPRETFDVSRCERPSRQSSSQRHASGGMKRGEKARRVP